MSKKFRVVRFSPKQRRISSVAVPIADGDVPDVAISIIGELLYRSGLLQETPCLTDAASRILRASRQVRRRTEARFSSCRRSLIEFSTASRDAKSNRAGVLWFSFQLKQGGNWRPIEIIGNLDELRRRCLAT